MLISPLPYVGESAQPALVLSIIHTCTLSNTLAERDHNLKEEGTKRSENIIIYADNLQYKNIPYIHQFWDLDL